MCDLYSRVESCTKGTEGKRFLRGSRIWDELLRRYPNEIGDWFTNGLGLVHFREREIYMSCRVRMNTLIWRTLLIPMALGESYPLLAFPDRFAAGWRGEKGSRRRAPIEIDSELTLRMIITSKIYFREGSLPRYEGNYYVTNRALTWFVVFGHHDDWMFFAADPDLVKVQDMWKTVARLRREGSRGNVQRFKGKRSAGS